MCIALFAVTKGWLLLDYLMICLVLVNSHLFPLPCGAGSTIPREGFNLSVSIRLSDVGLPSLFVAA